MSEDEIDAQIEKLREKVKRDPALYGPRLNDAFDAKYRAQKRAFEASIKRRAALHKKSEGEP